MLLYISVNGQEMYLWKGLIIVHLCYADSGKNSLLDSEKWKGLRKRRISKMIIFLCVFLTSVLKAFILVSFLYYDLMRRRMGDYETLSAG